MDSFQLLPHGVSNRRRAAATEAGAQARSPAGHRGRFEPRKSLRAVAGRNSARLGGQRGRRRPGPVTQWRDSPSHPRNSIRFQCHRDPSNTDTPSVRSLRKRMQTATSETESKSLDLSICVHHYTLRAPCPIIKAREQRLKQNVCQESKFVSARVVSMRQQSDRAAYFEHRKQGN